MNKQALTIAVLILPICLNAIGCATFAKKDSATKSDKSFFERIPFFADDEDEKPEPYPNPVKMAVTWTPDTLIQSGRTPTRGFGGRVFFYDEKSRPVPVDGTLVIHGFNDAEQKTEGHLKRFEFTPEQFTNHFSQTDLGASYSVWIPWDAVGGEQARISLVASFKPQEGEVVQGTPSTILLPGKDSKSNQTSLSHFSKQYERYKQATADAKPASGLTTTTIARRKSSKTLLDQPAINLPTPDRILPQSNGAEAIVKGGNAVERTPAFDLQIGRSRPTVMPASATESLRK